MNRLMRNKIKESIFKEEVVTQQEMLRQKLEYEIIKDNHRNRATKKILTDYAQEEGKKIKPMDYKYARI